MKSIKEIREFSGLSRSEFSEKYNIPVRSIINWETGQRNCPAYLIELLEKVVVQEQKCTELKCYDAKMLSEIGSCYRELLYVLNKKGKNPYPQAGIFPTKYFTMVYMQASRIGMPDELSDRIGQFMDCIAPNDWAESMNTPVPAEKQQYFLTALMGYNFGDAKKESKMFNTIILLKGERSLTEREYKNFQKGDTIHGIDSDPKELKRWAIDEKKAAKKCLSEYRCSYHHSHDWDIEEYALQYCICDEDGEYLDGADYDLAEEEESNSI